MKVRVKLFGTLSQRFPGYEDKRGIEVDIPDGAMVKDILAYLKITKSQGALLLWKAGY